MFEIIVKMFLVDKRRKMRTRGSQSDDSVCVGKCWIRKSRKTTEEPQRKGGVLALSSSLPPRQSIGGDRK